ncbi:hypothetical protein [Psychroserpens sp. Hel_I_66]|uniref:hypothetical protein n=1 Tax=Psychroserpens sp. Hel_I_66 TaxID=1250004 RepID=UPI000647D176|nr:hypothetical protein [Psychroserpens sp. Hel_I_66]
MKSRWYISILIITLTLLGGFASKQQTASPNQEIVLQFSSENVSIQDTKNAIENVKEQLEIAGISTVEVQSLKDGQLRLTYFSNSDVESIKILLSTACDLDYVSNENKSSKPPSEEKIITYDVDVYEIQQGNDLSELDGKLALETKAEYDRFFNPHVFGATENIQIDTKECIEKVAYKLHKSVAIAIDDTSYKIPEVRAGPTV